MSVDIIGENNQVILDLIIFHLCHIQASVLFISFHFFSVSSFLLFRFFSHCFLLVFCISFFFCVSFRFFSHCFLFVFFFFSFLFVFSVFLRFSVYRYPNIWDTSVELPKTPRVISIFQLFSLLCLKWLSSTILKTKCGIISIFIDRKFWNFTQLLGFV